MGTWFPEGAWQWLCGSEAGSWSRPWVMARHGRVLTLPGHWELQLLLQPLPRARFLGSGSLHVLYSPHRHTAGKRNSLHV